MLNPLTGQFNRTKVTHTLTSKGVDRIPNARDSIEFKLNSSNLSGFFLMKLSFLFYYIKAP